MYAIVRYMSRNQNPSQMAKKKVDKDKSDMPSKAPLKKDTALVKSKVLDSYERPYINENAESAMKAYRRIGYVDGVSSSEKGCEYSMLLVNDTCDLAITKVPILFDGKVFKTAKGTIIDMNKIVAIKKL